MSNIANSQHAEFVEVKPEERIKELNDIDHDIAKILRSASKAIGLLSNEDHGTINPKLEDVKTEFEANVREYYATLASTSVRLRRQVHALEEAGLIAEGTKFDANRAKLMDENMSSRRGGGGPLDNSWLNARAKDSTGQALKEESLRDMKQFLKHSNIDVEGRSPGTMQVDTET
ncbi:hypothetical protein LTR64_007653 [Lithohypha guttulata]|uniref:Mediator of RNA polymerase II transcription subunit 11 n=1 Tax=Lithohypha guttulata TaxID=1690604 RepID=A0AAN7SXR0_9EURO|nr:hypothetical protein LTR51_007162 [Lithohypha guttulata]KAK5084351.1 hypothetical protein LTR05_005427 [Lithohypha guttulata]